MIAILESLTIAFGMLSHAMANFDTAHINDDHLECLDNIINASYVPTDLLSTLNKTSALKLADKKAIAVLIEVAANLIYTMGLWENLILLFGLFKLMQLWQTKPMKLYYQPTST